MPVGMTWGAGGLGKVQHPTHVFQGEGGLNGCSHCQFPFTVEWLEASVDFLALGTPDIKSR